MANERILIAEDDNIIAMGIENILTMKGYHVLNIVSSGKELVQIAREHTPDCLLIDIYLKGDMDGIDAYRLIKEFYRIPAIYITAHSDETTINRAKETGPYGYILKPIKKEELYSVIELALYRHRMETKLKESEERWQFALEGCGDGVWDWNLDNGEVIFSDKWKNILGFSGDEIEHRYHEWEKRMHPEEKGKVIEELNRHLRGETEQFTKEYRLMCKDGTYKWVLGRGRIITRTPDGVPIRMIGTMTDITERKSFENQLQFQSSLLNQIRDRITATDLEGNIIYINDAECNSLKMQREDILGRNVHDYGENPKKGATQNEIIQTTLERGNWEGTVVNYDSHGNEIFFDSKTWLIRDENGKPIGMAGISSDITDQKKSENDLRESEERFRTLASLSPVGIYLTDLEGNCIYANKMWNEITGIDGEDISVDQWMSQIYHEDIEDVRSTISKAVKSKESFEVEFRFLMKEGKTNFVLGRAAPILDKEGNAVRYIGIVLDITGRKIADRAIQHYMDELETIADTATEVNRCQSIDEVCQLIGSKVYDMNRDSFVLVSLMDRNHNAITLRKYFGFNKNISSILKILGKDPRDMAFLHDDLQDESKKLLVSGKLEPVPGGIFSLSTGKVQESACREVEKFLGINQVYIIGLVLGSTPYGGITILKKDSGSVQGKFAIEALAKHITIVIKRLEDEEDMLASLKEKEILLKEIHHRVKNNMQIISSLMELQSGYIVNEKDRELFAVSQNRIYSMALIHEKLYQSGSLASIDFKDYIESLMNEISLNYSPLDTEITQSINAKKEHLSIDQAIPCAIIVNELVTNAYKYAFTGMKKGKLEIQFEKDESNNFKLTVWDNGIGLPENFELQKIKSLGLQLVSELTKQLHGKLDINRGKGTTFSIVFPAE